MMVSTDTLEYVRLTLALLLVASNVVVWVGVYLEHDKFPQPTKDAGWKMLLCGLAAEAALAVLLVVVDTTVSFRQKEEIIFLEAQIAPRRLDLEQQKLLIALFARFPGRTVHVSSYMQDVDASMLGEQILHAVSGANLAKDDKRMWISSFGTVTVGMAVTGTDAPLVEATTTILKSFGLTPVSNKPVSGNFMNVDEESAAFPLKIFVGAKPLPEGNP